jgi:hypothetical protein
MTFQCDADLPSSLRLGRVTVSCEGWDSPHDPYILKGPFQHTLCFVVCVNWSIPSNFIDSCALTYTLVRSDPSLEQGHTGSQSDWRRTSSLDSIFETFFWLVFGATALYIIVGLLRRLWSFDIFRWRRWTGGQGGSWPWGPGGGGGGGGGGPGDPPPPYSKFSQTPGHEESWRPGFWTGLAAGAAATSAANAWASRDRRRWESPQAVPRMAWQERPATTARYRNWDLGEGPSSSDLGPMRTSSGFGGTRNR